MKTRPRFSPVSKSLSVDVLSVRISYHRHFVALLCPEVFTKFLTIYLSSKLRLVGIHKTIYELLRFVIFVEGFVIPTVSMAC
jgi:hypothetical protein